MPSVRHSTSQAAPAIQNGQTGSRSAGGFTPATSAVMATSSFRVVTSGPERM